MGDPQTGHDKAHAQENLSPGRYGLKTTRPFCTKMIGHRDQDLNRYAYSEGFRVYIVSQDRVESCVDHFWPQLRGNPSYGNHLKATDQDAGEDQEPSQHVSGGLTLARGR